MIFYSDPNKQAQEEIFSTKINEINHPLLLFNQDSVKSFSSQKYLGIALATKSHFNLHLKNVQSKVNKTTGLNNKTIINYYLQIIYKASSRLRSHNL